MSKRGTIGGGREEFTFSKLLSSWTETRSAESSPVLYQRRHQKAYSFLNCASGFHSNAASDSKMDENKESPPYSPSSSTARSPPISPSSPAATSSASVGYAKRSAVWRNIKRLNFRSSKSHVDESQVDAGRCTSVEVLHFNGSSSSLTKDSPSTVGKFFRSGKASKSHKKSIIRADQSSEHQNTPKRSSINRQVEFASSDQVFPLSRELEEAGAVDMLASSPPVHCPPFRQSTTESVNSTTSEFFKNDTSSRASSVDAADGPSTGCASFLLKIHLHEGKDLVIRDASGSSDPYVKFKYKGKVIYKSNTVFKNLNPVWDEQMANLIDDPSVPVQVEVYDYDRFAMDDFMGSANVDLNNLHPNLPVDIKVTLSGSNTEQYMGYLLMQISLTPLNNEEQLQFIKKSARASPEQSGKKTSKPSQTWSSVVNIVLVEAKNLLPTDTQSHANLPDPYVRFKLGSDKYKSKAALKTLEPKWLEQFDMHVYDDQSHTLEVMVFDKRKDLFMGKCTVNLEKLEREITHHEWHNLEDGAGQIFFLISISGTVASSMVSDLKSYQSKPTDQKELVERYALNNAYKNLRDVGHLTVTVYKANGLASADIGGKSDPFCVLELINARLQTHTEYKTLSPEWNKIFTFNVKDINSVLEITVYDEDPNRKFDFLGKVAIPLLKVKNNEKRWFALKDRKLQRRAKGQILLEFELHWNPARLAFDFQHLLLNNTSVLLLQLRACVRSVNPKEKKYMVQEPKFKRQTFIRNVMRVKGFVMSAMDVGTFVQSCFNWDSPARSLIAFITFMLCTYFAEVYMLPIVFLSLFARGYLYRTVSEGLRGKTYSNDDYVDSDVDDDEGVDDRFTLFDLSTSIAEQDDLLNGVLYMFQQKNLVASEEKRGIKERLIAVQDTLGMVQNALDFIASSMERVKNTFNFSTPFLSYLAISALCLGTVVLYFVPIRWLIMLWGINKFTKKLRVPHAVPNNELLDFLSRVPSDDEVRQQSEFRPEPLGAMVNPPSSQPKRKRAGS